MVRFDQREDFRSSCRQEEDEVGRTFDHRADMSHVPMSSLSSVRYSSSTLTPSVPLSASETAGGSLSLVRPTPGAGEEGRTAGGGEMTSEATG